MSAFGGKADMPFCAAYVCFWPKADIGYCVAHVPFDRRPETVSAPGAARPPTN